MPVFFTFYGAVHIFLPRDAMLARYLLSSCVCLSQAGTVSKRLDESSWFWHVGFLPPIPHRVIKKFGYLELSQTQDSNFATASRSCCQQNSSTVELVDDTYDGRRDVYHPSVNCNPLLTPSLRFVVDLWYNLFLRQCNR